MPFVKNDTRINRGGRPLGSKNNVTPTIQSMIAYALARLIRFLFRRFCFLPP